MGTTSANIHVLDGDEQQLRALFPNADTGRWSERFVSVFSSEFTIGTGGRTAKDLSEKLEQPVLFVWIYDSDAVGFVIFQNGSEAAEHVTNPDGYNKLGNIAVFCEILGLPADDIPRLRTVWKKGDAEEQIRLTSLLFGAPLYHDSDMLPDRQYFRDVQPADKWISERSAPAKVRNKTKAELLQELTHYRNDLLSRQYVSEEPFDDENEYSSCQIWKLNADGTLSIAWSTEEHVILFESETRILGVRYEKGNHEGNVLYDSAGLLSKEIKLALSGHIYFLSDGGFFRIFETRTDKDWFFLIARFAPDGSRLWERKADYPGVSVFGCAAGEIILDCISAGTHWLERINDLTGTLTEKILCPFGNNYMIKAFNNGYWWVVHDGFFLRDGKMEDNGHSLMKLDQNLRPASELPLSWNPQEIFFSPDNVYVYVFCNKSRVIAINTETLETENTLEDKDFLRPISFDSAGRFWLQRGNSTLESRSADLTEVLSRHKLKGMIFRHHKDAQGVLCAAALNEKERILRIYKMTDVG